jgi:DNA polymerase III subunit epsilon
MTSQDRIERARQQSARWAKKLLAGEFVIFDSETTGLEAHDEFIQVGVVDHTGAVLVDALVRPQAPIHPKAQAVHGFSAADLADAPPFTEVFPALRDALTDRTVIAYNVDFDSRILFQACRRYALHDVPVASWQCAMKRYAGYLGRWNPRYNSFKWVRLTEACALEGIPISDAHTAAGDCLMTLALLKAMAADAEDGK